MVIVENQKNLELEVKNQGIQPLVDTLKEKGIYVQTTGAYTLNLVKFDEDKNKETNLGEIVLMCDFRDNKGQCTIQGSALGIFNSTNRNLLQKHYEKGDSLEQPTRDYFLQN